MEADIDNYPDFAVVWSFFNKFGKQLEMEDVLITDVIQWMKVQSTDSTPLVDVIVKLMRKTGMRVDKQRWQKQLSKVVVKHNVSLAIELENQGFYALQITKKLHIFKMLCEMQFDDNLKFKNTVNIEEADEQRFKPVGRDEDGLVYWHHEDSELNIRLYVEDEDEEEDCGWKVICRNKDDIEDLIQQLTDEPIQRKLNTESEEEEEDLVENKFQKFLKSQCTTEAVDEGNRSCKKEKSEDTGINQIEKGSEYSIDQMSVKREPNSDTKENNKMEDVKLKEEPTTSLINKALDNFVQKVNIGNLKMEPELLEGQLTKNALSTLPLGEVDENKSKVTSVLEQKTQCGKTEGVEEMEVGKSDKNLDGTPQMSVSKIVDVPPDLEVTDQNEDVAKKDSNIEFTGNAECEQTHDVPVEVNQGNETDVSDVRKSDVAIVDINGLKADDSHTKDIVSDRLGSAMKMADVEASKQNLTLNKEHVNLDPVIHKNTDSKPDESLKPCGEHQSDNNAISSVICNEGKMNMDTSNNANLAEDKEVETNPQEEIVKSSESQSTEKKLSSNLSPVSVDDETNISAIAQCSENSTKQLESNSNPEINVSSKAVSVIRLTNTMMSNEDDSPPVIADKNDGSEITAESEHTSSMMEVGVNGSKVTDSSKEKREISQQTSVTTPIDSDVFNIEENDERTSKEMSCDEKKEEIEAIDISESSKILPVSEQSIQCHTKEAEALQVASSSINHILDAVFATGKQNREDKNETISAESMTNSDLKSEAGKTNALDNQATDDITIPVKESNVQNKHEFSPTCDNIAELSVAEIKECDNNKESTEEKNEITLSKQAPVQELNTIPSAVQSEQKSVNLDAESTEIFSDNVALPSDKDAVDDHMLQDVSKGNLIINETEEEIGKVIRDVMKGMLDRTYGELDDDKKTNNQAISDEKLVAANVENGSKDVKNEGLCNGQDAGDSEKDDSSKKNKEIKAESKQKSKGLKKKRRKRGHFTRKRTETKQKGAPPVVNRTPRRKATKKSQLDQLKEDADLLFQEKNKGKTPGNTGETYRTRSGRIVKSAKKERETWQTFDADDLDGKNTKEEDADVDFRFGELKKPISEQREKKIPVKKKKVIDDTTCMKCGLSTHPGMILLCDSCNKGHHMACLTPPLMIVPDEEWFCPKCSQTKLIVKLKEIHADLGSRMKSQKRKAKQTQYRKMINEYTGISASNIIEQNKPEPKKSISKRLKRISSSSGSELGSLSDSSPSSPEIMLARRCRNTVRYDFSSFDKTIMDAIKSDIEAVSDTETKRPISGKDIRTIIAAEKGEDVLAEKEFTENKISGRRKKRKLTLGNLKSSDSEDADSGSNFSISSNSEMSEEEFQEFEISDEDSLSDERMGRRRGLRRKKHLPLIVSRKRSTRIRKRVIQEEWETSLSESSSDYEEVSKKKGKRKRNGYGRNSCNDSDEYVPSFAARERHLINDSDDNKVKKRKLRRVINSSSDDDKDNQGKMKIQSTKANSSDDCKWSSLSSGAEVSEEQSASDHEAARETNNTLDIPSVQ